MELAGRRHQRIPRTARRLAVSIAMQKGIGRTGAGSRSGRKDRAMRAVRGGILLRNA